MNLRGMSDAEIDELNASLREQFNSEAGLCMVASEDVLRKEWCTPEEDAAWEKL
jgi:hypothetical protein